MLTRNVEPGDLVQPGRVLLEIARAGDTELLVPVDEKNLALLSLGQKAQVIADAYPDRPFAAVVTFIAPSVDPQRGTVEVRLRVDPVPDYVPPSDVASVADLTKPAVAARMRKLIQGTGRDSGNMMLSAEVMQAYGLEAAGYRLQPGTVTIRCAVDCSAASVRDTAQLNPGRMLWIEVEPGGAFDIGIAEPIGSADFPVTMVVAGDMTVSNANAKLNGVVYTTGDTLANFGGLTLTGALVAQSDLRLSNGGINTVVYDAAMLGLLNRASGSFVRVPGSWRDF